MPLTGRESREPVHDADAVGVPLGARPLIAQRDVDRGEQRLVVERLLKEVRRPRFHRLDGERDVAMSGDDDHRNR